MTSPLVVGVGRTAVDFVGIAPRMPDTETPVDLERISVQVGGSAAVAAATTAALGCRARLVSRVADDFLGRFARRALTEAGVDTEHVLTDRGQLSGLTFAALAGGKRAAFTIGGDVGELADVDVAPETILRGADALLIDGSVPAAQATLAEAARDRGVPVIFDDGALHEGVGELVALADVFLCSERLASELAPRGELSDSLAELQRLGPGAVVITLGPAGCIGLHGDQLVRQHPFPIDVVDAAGAGDVFHGAFAAALLGELPFARCIELASAAAALSCTSLGAFAGIPERDEVMALIKKHR